MSGKRTPNEHAQNRITMARASLAAAKREARAAWDFYATDEASRNPDDDHRALRAQAATHLPEDMLELLGIDRYGYRCG